MTSPERRHVYVEVHRPPGYWWSAQFLRDIVARFGWRCLTEADREAFARYGALQAVERQRAMRTEYRRRNRRG